ncbi:T1SS secreted agglutinin RTX [Vibrio maritimus]|uniref:T1SS secreted agglutinin RTX n=1 Tax=Vibrio maritimus TaxID=990268 RepID=A0A090SMW0_9VIBR|nr:T1SS secreted agglutinin RTX [Vibrio maritimus]
MQGVSFDGADAYVFSQDQEVRIPLSEILANDSDPDGHSFSVTDIFGESLGDAYIDGDDVVFELPDDFVGSAQFQYEITDERGGTDTAIVSVLINPAPVMVESITTQDVDEGQPLVYSVTLDDTTHVKTFYEIDFGAASDTASDNDVDLTGLIFSDGVTYNAVTGELEVPANVDSFTITLPTVADNRYEGDESFTLVVGEQTAQANILDDDVVTLSLSGGGEISEDAGSVPFTLNLSTPSDVEFTLDLAVMNGTTEDADFDHANTVISYVDDQNQIQTIDIIGSQFTVPVGVTELNIGIGIFDDDVYELDEDFTLKITESATNVTTNGDVGVEQSAIISDDGQIGDEPGGDNDNLAPVIDLDESESGDGYAATFTEGDDPIMIVDSDVVITDDIDVITKAEVKLTNRKVVIRSRM